MAERSREGKESSLALCGATRYTWRHPCHRPWWAYRFRQRASPGLQSEARNRRLNNYGVQEGKNHPRGAPSVLFIRYRSPSPENERSPVARIQGDSGPIRRK
jgi:hypothetical protein